MNATAQERHVALYSILVDGEQIDTRLAKRVREVRVLNYLRLPDVCTVTAIFPKGAESVDEHPFTVGSRLEIKLGAREQLTTTTLFAGDVVSLDAEFGPGTVELLVRGLDSSHTLQRSRNVRTFQNQTASDIVEKILRDADAGLEIATDPSGGDGVVKVAPLPLDPPGNQIGDVGTSWCDDVPGGRAQSYWSIADGALVLPKMYSVRRTLAGKSIGGKLPRTLSANAWIAGQF